MPRPWNFREQTCGVLWTAERSGSGSATISPVGCAVESAGRRPSLLMEGGMRALSTSTFSSTRSRWRARLEPAADAGHRGLVHAANAPSCEAVTEVLFQQDDL